MTVVGAGYVGLALCRRLDGLGHEVTGVRRSPAPVREAGVSAVAADVTNPETLEALPDADAVVFAASSGGRGADAARRVFVDGLRNTIRTYADRSSPPDRLVYTSSTGVYGDHDGDWVDEDTSLDPQTEKTEVLVEAERVAVETAGEAGIDGTVARFAGLYGPERYRLSRYLEGPVTEGYLNSVHRDDAAGAVAFLLTGRSNEESGGDPRARPADHARGEVVVVADDEPVDKWSFADWLADECGVERPDKRTKAERLAAGDLSAAARRRIQTSKRVDNAKLRGLGYDPEYPTVHEGYRAAVADHRAADDG